MRGDASCLLCRLACRMGAVASHRGTSPLVSAYRGTRRHFPNDSDSGRLGSGASARSL